jgi:hypothetical protein
MRLSEHVLPVLPLVAIRRMDKQQSTHSRFSLLPTKEKRDRAIDTTLDAVDTSLELLDFASDFLPIAGVGTVVTVLRSMVAQIRVRLNPSICLGAVTDVGTEHTFK